MFECGGGGSCTGAAEGVENIIIRQRTGRRPSSHGTVFSQLLTSEAFRKKWQRRVITFTIGTNWRKRRELDSPLGRLLARGGGSDGQENSFVAAGDPSGEGA